MSNPEREERIKTEKYWVTTIISEGLERLSDTEETFIHDMEAKLNSTWNTLSSAQHDWLEKIYDRITR